MTSPRLPFLAPILLILAAPSSWGDTLAVFGKSEITLVNPAGFASASTDHGARLHFIAALAKHERDGGKYAQALPIVNPPEWGRTVKGSSGTVSFDTVFEQGLAAHLGLQGLLPNHLYKLCLNGTPDHPGNTLLLDAVPGLPNERYYDFLNVSTDATGSYESNLGVYLLPGNYHVRIYVKDATDSKIVLYRDFFDFTVTEEPMPSKKS